VKSRRPSYTYPVSPSAQDTVDLLAVGQGARRVAGAHDGGNAQLASDDRGVTCTPAPVGDDRRARFMIGSQSGSVMSATSTSPALKACICSAGLQDPDRAGADLLPDRPAGHDRLAGIADPEALHRTGGLPRLHRLRAGLQDVEPAVPPVLSPLDVHRPAVMLLDHQRMPRQLGDLVVGQAEQPALRRLDVDEGGPCARPYGRR